MGGKVVREGSGGEGRGGAEGGGELGLLTTGGNGWGVDRWAGKL